MFNVLDLSYCLASLLQLTNLVYQLIYQLQVFFSILTSTLCGRSAIAVLLVTLIQAKIVKNCLFVCIRL